MCRTALGALPRRQVSAGGRGLRGSGSSGGPRALPNGGDVKTWRRGRNEIPDKTEISAYLTGFLLHARDDVIIDVW